MGHQVTGKNGVFGSSRTQSPKGAHVSGTSDGWMGPLGNFPPLWKPGKGGLRPLQIGNLHSFNVSDIGPGLLVDQIHDIAWINSAYTSQQLWCHPGNIPCQTRYPSLRADYDVVVFRLFFADTQSRWSGRPRPAASAKSISPGRLLVPVLRKSLLDQLWNFLGPLGWIVSQSQRTIGVLRPLADEDIHRATQLSKCAHEGFMHPGMNPGIQRVENPFPPLMLQPSRWPM